MTLDGYTLNWYKDIGGQWVEWSKIDNYDEYFKIQMKIRNHLKNNNKYCITIGDKTTKNFKISNIPFEAEFVIWEGEHTIGVWDGNQDLAWGGYDWSQAKPGDILQIVGEPANPAAEWWCLSLRVGDSWGALTGVPGQYDNCTVVQVTLTKEIIDHLVSANGLVLTGQDYKFTKISIIREISQETTIWEGEADPQGYAVNLELGGDDNSDWRNANLQVGQTIKIYFNLTNPAEWSIQAFDAHWGGQLKFSDAVGTQFNQNNWDGSLGYVSFVVDEAIQTVLTTSAGWGKSIILQGAGLIFTQITLM
jgi:hypothetical protein